MEAGEGEESNGNAEITSFFYNPSHPCASNGDRYFICLLYTILSFEFAGWCGRCRCLLFYILISFRKKVPALSRFLLYCVSLLSVSPSFLIFEKYKKKFGSPICCQNCFYLNTLSCTVYFWLAVAIRLSRKAHKFRTDKNK